jgi:hypothetical protein
MPRPQYQRKSNILEDDSIFANLESDDDKLKMNDHSLNFDHYVHIPESPVEICDQFENKFANGHVEMRKQKLRHKHDEYTAEWVAYKGLFLNQG